MANTIDLVIRAQNKASSEIQKVQKDLGNLEKAASGTGKSLDSMVGTLAAGVGISLGVAGVVQLTRAISDLAIESGKVQQLRASFDGLAVGVGQSSQAMLQAMRQASDGLVSDADLILSANKAMLLGVADTGEELSALLEVARSRGAAMGLTTTQAFNDIVTGLGRESALILDNLGITIDLEGVMQQYAATLGLTAAQLDSAQRKQALLNEVMRQSAGIAKPIETAATAWERASVAIDNAKVALGEAFGPVVQKLAEGVTFVATGMAEAMDSASVVNLTANVQQLNRQIEATETSLRDLQEIQALIGGETDPMKLQQLSLQYGINAFELRNQIDALWKQRDALLAQREAAQQAYNAALGLKEVTVQTRQEVWSGISAWGDYANSEAWAAKQAEILGAASDRMKAHLQALAQQSDVTGSALRSAFLGAVDLLGASGALAGFTEAQKKLNLLRDDWKLSGMTAEEVLFRETEYLSGVNQGLSDQRQAIADANKEMEKYASSGIKAAQNAYDDLTSKVAGFVGGLLSIGDISVDGGPRQDAANENARRLAAIANEGLIDQSWLEEFKNEAPAIFDEIVSSADPQGAAKRLYEEFQAGMHPELLDREMIKSNIRRMIVGEETMNAYVTEIAQELAGEMNVSFPTAYKAALGEGGGGFADGFTEGTDALKATLAGEAATFKDSGTAILESFQAGIEAQWATFLEYWKGKMQELRNQLPFSEPKDPTSPLRGLGKSGQSMVRMIQDGIDRESFNVNVLGGRAQAAATTTNNTMPVSITVNVSGGADGSAISAAVQNGVLSAARSMGIR